MINQYNKRLYFIRAKKSVTDKNASHLIFIFYTILSDKLHNKTFKLINHNYIYIMIFSDFSNLL